MSVELGPVTVPLGDVPLGEMTLGNMILGDVTLGFVTLGTSRQKWVSQNRMRGATTHFNRWARILCSGRSSRFFF